MRMLNKYKFPLFAILISVLPLTIGFAEAFQKADRLFNIVSLFISISAASLVTTIAIVGDSKFLLPGNWKKTYYKSKGVKIKMYKFISIFMLYMSVLLFIVICEVISILEIKSLNFLYYILAYLTTLSFVSSLWLPFVLLKTQIKRLDEEVENRKKVR